MRRAEAVDKLRALLPDLRAQLPHVAWRDIAGMRDTTLAEFLARAGATP